MSWQVQRGAGDVADVEYLIGLEEVVEGVLDFFSWDPIFVREVALHDCDVFSDADQGMRLASSPEGLLNVVGGREMVSVGMGFQYHFDGIAMLHNAIDHGVCRFRRDSKQRGLKVQDWVDDSGFFRIRTGHYILP